MIDAEYCRLLARYNRWMNERLYASAATLSDDQRKRDRGAFFGSIHRTLAHILWGDRVWLGRFTAGPPAGPAYGADAYPDFDALAREREHAGCARIGVSRDRPAAAFPVVHRMDFHRRLRVPRFLALG